MPSLATSPKKFSFTKIFSRFSACFSCVVILLCSSNTLAVEFTPETYDLYIGDLNNDGMPDYYFHGKDQFLILHGEINIPILITGVPGYAIYREGNDYTPPTAFSLTNSLLTSYLTQGRLRKAILHNSELGSTTDALYWKDNANGFTSVLVRGSDVSAPAFMLASYADIDLPLMVEVYDPGNSSIPNISDRNNVLSLRDVNGDGRKDLVWGTQVMLSNFNGLLMQKTYSLSLTASGPIVEDYTYDELGRLTRVDSSDGVSQAYILDAENNRSRKNDVKGI